MEMNHECRAEIFGEELPKQILTPQELLKLSGVNRETLADIVEGLIDDID